MREVSGTRLYDAKRTESLHVLDTSLDPMLWTQPALTGELPGARHGHAALNVGGETCGI